jgi:hypothetical protein
VELVLKQLGGPKNLIEDQFPLSIKPRLN